MDIGEFYDIVKFISNKNQQGYLSPTEFNRSVNLAQKQLMCEIVEAIQGWDANRKRIRLPMGNAQPTIQKIAPFIRTINAASVPSTGRYPKPTGLEHLLAIRFSSDTGRVIRSEHDRVYSHISSVIDPIEDAPIYVEYDEYYQIYPVDIGTIGIDWIVTPPDAKYAFTLDGNGRQVYDLGSSIQLLWGETEIGELISRVLFMFGVSIQAQNLVGYYQSIKNDGQ